MNEDGYISGIDNWEDQLRREAKAAKDESRKNIARAWLDRLEDITANGDSVVVGFSKQYVKGGKEYEYVGLYVNATKLWYFTGNTQRSGISNMELAIMLAKEVEVDLISVLDVKFTVDYTG